MLLALRHSARGTRGSSCSIGGALEWARPRGERFEAAPTESLRAFRRSVTDQFVVLHEDAPLVAHGPPRLRNPDARVPLGLRGLVCGNLAAGLAAQGRARSKLAHR